MTRNQIIKQMCLTYRHDYDLDRTYGEELSSGINDSERQYIWDMMTQIYDNVIGPNMEFKRVSSPAHSCDIPGCAMCDPCHGL